MLALSAIVMQCYQATYAHCVGNRKGEEDVLTMTPLAKQGRTSLYWVYAFKRKLYSHDSATELILKIA